MNNMEQWKDVPGYEGRYKVSSFGFVLTLKRTRSLINGGVCTYPEKIMKPFVDKLGYARVGLSIDGKVKNFQIHFLVLSTFHPKPHPCLEVNHKDGNKINNNLSNLEWVTKSQNVLHSYHVIGRKKATRPTQKKVVMLSVDGEPLQEFESVNDAARQTDNSPGNVCWACKGKIKILKNRRYEYAKN